MQRFWFEQFGGTFRLARPVVSVINADHDAAWYVVTPDGIHDDSRWFRLGNISTEVRRKLGVKNTRYVSYPSSVVTTGPRVGANFDGAWMDSDDLRCISGEMISVAYPEGSDNNGTVAHCLGHVVHELGHIFGLDHEGPPMDCMQQGFYDTDVMCHFSAVNRRTVRRNPDNAGYLSLELKQAPPTPVSGCAAEQ